MVYTRFTIKKKEGKSMGDYVGTAAMAELWGCKQSTITKWCREGKVEGAEQDSKGSPWRIPVDAQCPAIKRKGRNE